MQDSRSADLVPSVGKYNESIYSSDSICLQVTPAEVLAEGAPGPLALVVDVPGAAYLPALLAHPTLQRCQAPAGEQTANETKTFLSTALLTHSPCSSARRLLASRLGMP